MPSDFGHDVPSVEFRHDQCATVLPEGMYRGDAIEAPYVLGNNGMGKSWRTVRIVGGDQDGNIVSVWDNNGTQT